MQIKMADDDKPAVLPWGMNKEALQPNSVKGISQSKIRAFNVGRMNPLKKPSPFLKKKEEKEERKKLEAQETAEVFEKFVASFEDSGTTGKTFVRGSTSIKPAATGDEAIPNPSSGSVYRPKSKFMQKKETQKEEEPLFSMPKSTQKKSFKKKSTEKKKSILELFREELKRSQDQRLERRAAREASLNTNKTVVQVEAPVVEQEEFFNVDEYREMSAKGSFDTGDPLTTNLYVGNINPKMNEENLCQLFGKFGPLASVKVMWPRTEEEKARNKNCGFVAYMKREDAEKALEHFKDTTVMDYEIQIGWGKAVRVPPQPIYVPPDKKEEEDAKTLDPPSGLPFNAQPQPQKITVTKSSSSSSYMNVPPPDESGDDNKEVNKDKKGSESFEDILYNAVIKVVIPIDVELLKLIHRMIEFVIREGPMFEAMIMNREMNNPSFQFLFDNRSPAHVYYRWKLFSILQGDSPETWRTEEFRMFENGSLWKPPPLKNLRSKVLPPLEQDIIRRGQLSSRQRDEFEDQLRNISMEREKIKKSMVWCLDHSDSAEEIVECICEALCISETPLPIKVARLYLANDILLNCSSSVPNSSNFRRGFEGRLMLIIEHFHSVMTTISSRIRAEQFKHRVLSCLRAWDQMSVYHYNVVDKLRLTFIGKTIEEIEKQKAFDTVAALIGTSEEVGNTEPRQEENLDGVPLFDITKPIDFSGGAGLDGEPMDALDGVPYSDPGIDGEPMKEKIDDIDGVPLDEEPPKQVPVVAKSKWELVDYDDDSDESDDGKTKDLLKTKTEEVTKEDERQQLNAEVNERKRRILREVEVKAMKLYDALESSGSYTRAEITERVDRYRDKLMQEAVEPKFSPSPSKEITSTKEKSHSPSPSTLEKYCLVDSPEPSSKQQRSRSLSSNSSDYQEHRQSRSQSPVAGRKKSPTAKRSKSPAERRRSRSTSPVSHGKSSRSRRYSRSKSRSPNIKSKSPTRWRSRSHSRSKSPVKSSRKRSRSPRHGRRRSRSRSPSSSKKKSRKRSRSPHKSRSKRSKY